MHFIVLFISVLLIVLISFDAFSSDTNFLTDGLYMRVQLPVCLVYLLYFAWGLYTSANRKVFLRQRWIFFIISIPYGWIMNVAGIAIGGTIGYILHLMPTVRAVLALAIVVAALSSDKVTSLFWTYLTILLLCIYFASLIFYLHERDVNPGIHNYWSALWWCLMQATTLGATFYAVTTIGKILAMTVSAMGVLMFPLFTVFLTKVMQRIQRPSAKKC